MKKIMMLLVVFGLVMVVSSAMAEPAEVIKADGIDNITGLCFDPVPVSTLQVKTNSKNNNINESYHGIAPEDCTEALTAEGAYHFDISCWYGMGTGVLTPSGNVKASCSSKDE